MRFEYSLNDRNMRKALAAARMQSATTAKIMRRIAARMHYEVEQNFADEGRPPWLPLAESTRKRRNKKGYTGKTLDMRGDLAGSVYYEHDRYSATVYNRSQPYARIHEYGGWAGRGRKTYIPARPYLQQTDQAIDDYAYMVEAWLMEGVEL